MVIGQNVVVTHDHQTFDEVQPLFLEMCVQPVAFAPIKRTRGAGHDRGHEQYGKEGKFGL